MTRRGRFQGIFPMKERQIYEVLREVCSIRFPERPCTEVMVSSLDVCLRLKFPERKGLSRMKRLLILALGYFRECLQEHTLRWMTIFVLASAGIKDRCVKFVLLALRY